MISVRTKGIALTKPLPIDEEGFSVFNLDESKFDPFDVLLATMAKLGYVAPERDEKFEAMRLNRMRLDALAR